MVAGRTAVVPEGEPDRPRDSQIDWVQANLEESGESPMPPIIGTWRVEGGESGGARWAGGPAFTASLVGCPERAALSRPYRIRVAPVSRATTGEIGRKVGV